MAHSPSIVPDSPDRDVYLVLDDFGGRLGLAWRETEPADTELEHLIENLLSGQYAHPVRIVAFNTTEGWSRDVTEDIARELAARSAGRDLSQALHEFIEQHTR